MSKQDWTSAEVIEKLRKRHPATQAMGARRIPGPWTCIEEWMCMDLLAVCAITSQGRVPYARVGYEVKVSRSDYRSELRDPSKRAEAVAACHEFYFAVPKGLLTSDEIAGLTTGPTALYVPDDVGLVVVDGRGTKLVKEAPLNRDPNPPFFEGNKNWADGKDLHALIRWVSARPDPRHEGVVEEARQRGREIAAVQRKRKEERKRAVESAERRRAERGEGLLTA